MDNISLHLIINPIILMYNCLDENKSGDTEKFLKEHNVS